MTGDAEVAAAIFDAVFVVRIAPDLQVEYVSEGIEQFTGHSVHEHLADTDLWLNALDDHHREILPTVFHTDPGVVSHVTLRWSHSDGRAVWGRQVTRKEVRPDGSEVLYGGLAHLSDQQVAEAEADLDGRYAMVVFRLDMQGCVVWVSDSIRTVADWSPQDLVGRRAREFLDDAGRAVIDALTPRVLAGETRSGVVVRIRPPERDSRFVSLSARPVLDETTGEPAGVIVSWRDVDELVRARLEAESERQVLRAALDAQLDPQVVLEAVRDAHDRIVDFRMVELNPAACEALDVTRAEAVGTPLLALVPGVGGTEQWEVLAAVVRDRQPLVLNDQPFHSFLSGGTRRFDLRAVPVHDGLSLTWRDVTQRHQEAAALAASEARYRELAENATDVVYRTALDGTTEWVSEGVEKVLGFTPDEFVGRNGRDLVSPQDREFVELATAEVLAGKRSSARFRMPTKAGETRWVESTIHPVYDDEGQPVGFVGGWRDIQAEVEAEEKLDARVRTDDLTGLVNRGEVLARLTQLLSPANPHRGRLAVAFCDLDGFKAVNDARGHAVGDVLLQTVATRVRECVRAGDTVARMGGDEFLLVLDGIPDLPTATHVAEKVRDALRGPLVMDGRRVPVSVSIGVTMADPHDDVDGLIARADRAMYQAKQAGRDRVVAAT